MSIITKSKSFNLFNYLDEGNIQYKESPTHIILNHCPFCNKNKYKLYINKEDKLFYCFLCDAGKKSNIFHLIAKLDGISYEEVLVKYNVRFENLNRNLEFIDLTKKEESRKIKINVPEIHLPYNFLNFSNLSNPFLNDGLDYIKKRGISLDLAIKYDLRFSFGMKRLIFPLKYDNKVVGWQGRDVTSRSTEDKSYPKSLTSKNLKKSEVLYNYDNVFYNEEIMITEGPIDCIKCDKIGAVALFGKKMSKHQEELIKEMPNLKRITIALDPEESIDIYNTALKFNSFYDVYVLKFPIGTDAGDYTPEEIFKMYIKDKYKFKKNTLVEL